MTNSDQAPRTTFWLLSVLFLGSGCSALIYEIVWFQLLELVIGSSAVSVAVLLGTFMGGMCLGSLFSPRIFPGRHPLRVCAFVELAIGVFGLLMLLVLPYAGGLYTRTGAYGFSGLLLRSLICSVCLLPPTAMMGATLPIVARWAKSYSDGDIWLAVFYATNIGGGVFGSLITGYYLLRVWDVTVATYVAAGTNLVIAMSVFSLSKRIATGWTAEDSRQNFSKFASGAWTVCLAIALSGFSALGAEVVWTRLLALILGGTVYTFSLIVAVFLFGLGSGGAIGSMMLRWRVSPRSALAVCQISLVAAILWAAYMLASSIPYWPIYPPLSQSLWFTFQLDLIRCALAIFPAALLWGASFPLAFAAISVSHRDFDNAVAVIYAANTAGAICGALGFSLIFIRLIGTQHAEQVLMISSCVATLLLCVPAILKNGRLALLAGLLGIILIPQVPAPPAALFAYGRLMALRLGLVDSQSKTSVAPNILYVGEGLNTSVAVTRNADNLRTFHVSGKIEASTGLKDMQLQRMLGNLPALTHPDPRSVLVVGFGAGVTAGTFVLYPGIERIVICEIEPLIPQVVSQYFRDENNNVLQDPRVSIVYDDARHYILTTNERFDIITSDPIHPWVKGSAALYTREYFELLRRHLNPGGVITQWVPLYDTGEETVKSELATFFETFPKAAVFSTTSTQTNQDLVLLASAGALSVNLDDLNLRLYRSDHSRVARSLQEVGFRSTIELFSTYLSRGSDLTEWLKGAEINRDLNLRLQYLAGSEVNNAVNQAYKKMLATRNFPEDVFAGSEVLKGELRYMMLQPALRGRLQ